jgi:hypothetical protein
MHAGLEPSTSVRDAPRVPHGARGARAADLTLTLPQRAAGAAQVPGGLQRLRLGPLLPQPARPDCAGLVPQPRWCALTLTIAPPMGPEPRLRSRSCPVPRCSEQLQRSGAGNAACSDMHRRTWRLTGMRTSGPADCRLMRLRDGLKKCLAVELAVQSRPPTHSAAWTPDVWSGYLHASPAGL